MGGDFMAGKERLIAKFQSTPRMGGDGLPLTDGG